MTSWVIINKRTGRKIFETYSEETANEVREQHKGTLEAIPIELWLSRLNEQKAEQEAKAAVDRFITKNSPYA